MAADVLSRAGRAVTLYDQMPSVGRKLLMAGRGGLNLTHSEELDRFLSRYGASAERLTPAINKFSPSDLRAWADELGQPTFVGSSGRVFPVAHKASPLLRAWLMRLIEQDVHILTRRHWTGWHGDQLIFQNADGGTEAVLPAATILALGGASWPRLGATGTWAGLLHQRGIDITALRPSNCGFTVPWSILFRSRFEGQPLKGIALSFNGQSVRGEAMITSYGLEGGAVYALSAPLRDAIEQSGSATLHIDLRPDLPLADIAARLNTLSTGQTLATILRKALNLAPVAINLMRESAGTDLPRDTVHLAALIKAAPVTVTGTQPIERAISTAGGIALTELDQHFMLRKMPGTFAAGEMLDWEAPTGGDLLQACLATGMAAAMGAIEWLERGSPA